MAAERDALDRDRREVRGVGGCLCGGWMLGVGGERAARRFVLGG
jgi:hypothetical protein